MFRFYQLKICKKNLIKFFLPVFHNFSTFPNFMKIPRYFPINSHLNTNYVNLS